MIHLKVCSHFGDITLQVPDVQLNSPVQLVN